MAEEKQKSEEESAKALQIKTETGISVEEMSAQLKEMQPGMELTGEYYKFEVGEECRMHLIGTTKMNSLSDEGGQIDALRLLTEDSKFVVTAEVVLRSTLADVAKKAEKDKKPVGILIQCTGQKGPVGQQYKTFKVFPLS